MKPHEIAAVVTRDGDVVPADEAMDEGSVVLNNPLHDRVLKGKAYKMFLETSMDVSDIALSLGVSTQIVATWVRTNKWRDRKQEIEREIMSGIESQYIDFLRTNKMETLKRQMELGLKLEGQISRLLSEIEKGHIPPSQELKRVAEALKLATDVTARAAGIKDTTVSDRVVDNTNNAGKPPLVVVLGPMPDAPKIKVTEGVSVRIEDNQE